MWRPLGASEEHAESVETLKIPGVLVLSIVGGELDKLGLLCLAALGPARTIYVMFKPASALLAPDFVEQPADSCTETLPPTQRC
jgi:hypothetical protein